MLPIQNPIFPPLVYIYIYILIYTHTHFYLFYYSVGDTGFGIQIIFSENNLYLTGKGKKPLNLYQSWYDL